MMNIKFVITTVFILLFLSSCENSSNSNSKEELDTTSNENEYPVDTPVKITNEEILFNKYFKSESRDDFGVTIQVVHFEPNGSGEFFWEWSVGETIERGSSPMTWNLENETIFIKYRYTSKYGEITNESLNLSINGDELDELTETYGSTVFVRISGYSQNSSSSSNNNMIDAINNINDPSYCSLCNGTGREINRAQSLLGGEDSRPCPMCDGKGKRSY